MQNLVMDGVTDKCSSIVFINRALSRLLLSDSHSLMVTFSIYFTTSLKRNIFPGFYHRIKEECLINSALLREYI